MDGRIDLFKFSVISCLGQVCPGCVTMRHGLGQFVGLRIHLLGLLYSAMLGYASASHASLNLHPALSSLAHIFTPSLLPPEPARTLANSILLIRLNIMFSSSYICASPRHPYLAGALRGRRCRPNAAPPRCERGSESLHYAAESWSGSVTKAERKAERLGTLAL